VCLVVKRVATRLLALRPRGLRSSEYKLWDKKKFQSESFAVRRGNMSSTKLAIFCIIAVIAIFVKYLRACVIATLSILGSGRGSKLMHGQLQRRNSLENRAQKLVGVCQK